MSKKPRKHQKKHVQTRPNVQRYTAVVRSPLGEWWHEHKKQVKTITSVLGGALLFIFLIYELVRLIVGR